MCESRSSSLSGKDSPFNKLTCINLSTKKVRSQLCYIFCYPSFSNLFLELSFAIIPLFQKCYFSLWFPHAVQRALFHSSLSPQKNKTHRRQGKTSSSKKLTCKETLRQVFICLKSRTPYPSPYTLYTCIQYSYSHREGGRRVEPERKGKGQQLTTLGWKYPHDWMYARNWMSMINTCREVP
jgi:hypothetical protein